MGTFVGSGRHCNGAARDDVSNDLMTGVTGENYIWSFGVVREHPTDFFAGAEAYYAAYKSVDIAERIMPVDSGSSSSIVPDLIFRKKSVSFQIQ